MEPKPIVIWAVPKVLDDKKTIVEKATIFAAWMLANQQVEQGKVAEC